MSDNGIAVEPREAQRPTSLAARTPQAAILGNGDIAVGARRTANGRPGGPASLACHVGAVAQLPGASRRSIPSFRGEKENRDAGPGRPKNQAAGRRSVGLSGGCLKIESGGANANAAPALGLGPR